MNFVVANSVSTDVASVRWEFTKPVDKLFCGWSGAIGAFLVFAILLYGADWFPIRSIAFVALSYLVVFATNLCRASLGRQRAFARRTGNELIFDLGFPHYLLDRDQPKIRSLRDVLFMKMRISIAADEVHSVVVHPFHNDASVRVVLKDGSSSLIAEGEADDIRELAQSIKTLSIEKNWD